MIDFLPFLKVLPIYGIMLMVPGPDFMLVSSLSLSRSRAAGLQGAAGIATGFLLYSSLSLWGLGYVFERMMWLMLAVKILGGLYLCYLGVLLWRSSFRKQAAPQDANARPKNKNAYVMGVLTNFTNPKVVAFFASIFALTLKPDATDATKIVTSLLCAVTAFGWFAFVAAVLSAPRVQRRYRTWGRAIDRLAGSIFVLFGLRVLTQP